MKASTNSKGPPDVEGLADRGETGGWASVLGTLSPYSRFFGLVLLVTETGLGTATYAAGSDSLRTAIVAAMVFIFVVAMVLVYLLEAKAIAKDDLVIPVQTEGRSSNGTIRFDYDVYVATAVAAIGDDDRSARMADVGALAKAIERSRGASAPIRVFNACAKIKTRTAFDDPAVALSNNIKRMRASRHLALFYFENVPTSALIEVGMALSLGKDNIWFLKHGIELPFLMAGQPMAEKGMPNIRVVRFGDVAELKHLIETHGAQYFPVESANPGT